MKKTLFFLTVLLGLISLPGCGGTTGGVGPGMDPQEAVVKDVGDLLRCGSGKHSKLSDLFPFETNFPKSFNSIKSGSVVIYWGGSMLGEGEAGKGEEVIIAFEKDAESLGGWVLFTNGTVKKLTAAEFSASKKAKIK